MTTDQLTVRSMQPHHAEAAAALLRASFDADVHPYIAYCQEETAEYLATVVGFPMAFSDRYLYVMEGPLGRIAGFAEFRTIEVDTDLLAYIVIDAAARGQRLAEQLVRHHVARRRDAQALLLDVFAHNSPARTLYERLGFEEIDATSWWSRSLPEARQGRLRFVDWHGSLASLRAYGCCMLTLDRADVPVRLGLPSSRVVRLPDTALFQDDELLGALRALLHSLRDGLLFSPRGTPPPTGGSHVLDSLRLRVNLPLPPDRR